MRDNPRKIHTVATTPNTTTTELPEMLAITLASIPDSIASLVYSAGYVYWIFLAVFCRLVCFAALAGLYILMLMLMQPRIDGNKH